MGEKQLTNILINDFEWNSLILPKDLPTEEKEKHAEILSDYLSRRFIHESSDIPLYEKTSKIHLDNSFIEAEEIEFEKITNDDLFEYILSENIEVNPYYLFPKTADIDRVFWFLHHLSKEDISKSKLAIENIEELSIIFHEIVENALFLGFFERVGVEGTIYLIPTSDFEEFMTLNVEDQYHYFLSTLGRNESISEALRIQLNDSIFDSISRQMLRNILVKDRNIQVESLKNDEVTKIVNNFRYWYLSIKNAILMN